MANFNAQMDALAFGKTKEEVHLELKFSGNSDKIKTLLQKMEQFKWANLKIWRCLRESWRPEA